MSVLRVGWEIPSRKIGDFRSILASELHYPEEKITPQQMTVEYGLSEFLLARYGYVIARQRGEIYSKRRYYFSAIWPIILIGLGAISAFSAVSSGGSLLFLLMGFILAIEAIKSVVRTKSHARVLEDLYFPRHLGRDQIRVRLEISNTGIRECQGEVVLSAGWRDVVSTNLEQELLIITLRGFQQIIIPRSSFGISELDLEDIRNEVERLLKSEGKIETSEHQMIAPD